MKSSQTVQECRGKNIGRKKSVRKNYVRMYVQMDQLVTMYANLMTRTAQPILQANKFRQDKIKIYVSIDRNWQRPWQWPESVLHVGTENFYLYYGVN